MRKRELHCNIYSSCLEREQKTHANILLHLREMWGRYFHISSDLAAGAEVHPPVWNTVLLLAANLCTIGLIKIFSANAMVCLPHSPVQYPHATGAQKLG